MLRRSNKRSDKGSQIAELAAVLVAFFPLALITIVAANEAIQVYEIYSSLNQVAIVTARKLAIAYQQNPTNTVANPGTVLSNITFCNIVKSSSQFTSPTSTSGWNTSVTPATVTVVVSFKSGQYGCPNFPDPDPLQIGSNLTLTATASAPLQ